MSCITEKLSTETRESEYQNWKRGFGKYKRLPPCAYHQINRIWKRLETMHAVAQQVKKRFLTLSTCYLFLLNENNAYRFLIDNTLVHMHAVAFNV